MPNALKQYAEARPTPRNKLMGLLADTLTRANNYATLMDPRYENKRENQTLGLLADAVSLGSLAKTAERISYGEPLTNKGKANVAFMKPETADALMMAPLSPRNALAALGMVGGLADNGAMRAATVWHGSPHKFDKFDASKIGAGEGAQAYGHGLYLAEDRGIADVYRKKLTGVDGAPATRPDDSLQVKIGRLQFEVDRLRKSDDPSAPAMIRAYEGRIRELDGGGNLYKIDLPDDQIAKMIDWDKSMADHPLEVRNAWAKAYRAKFGRIPEFAPSAITGAQAVDMIAGGSTGMQQFVKESADASARLARQGIPGIRYLDGSSRDAGKGSSNFVVFPGNESLLTILERNGQPLR